MPNAKINPLAFGMQHSELVIHEFVALPFREKSELTLNP